MGEVEKFDFWFIRVEFNRREGYRREGLVELRRRKVRKGIKRGLDRGWSSVLDRACGRVRRL